jgi:hypothetical protein
MTGKMTWLPVTLLIFGSSLAAAQTPGAKPGSGDRPASEQSVPGFKVDVLHNATTYKVETFDSLRARQAMYEDIEIMRRLLSSKLEWLNPSLAWYVGQEQMLQRLRLEELLRQAPLGTSIQMPPEIASGAHLRVLDVEGSYLPGYGVVYTVTLPPPQRKLKAEPPSPQPKPLTDWERIRKQLHGEKEPDKSQQVPAQPKELGLNDVILKSLFENGRHFVRLNENEKLTVVVTFRPAEQQGVQETATSSDRNAAASGTWSAWVGNTGRTSSSSATSPVGDATTASATKNPSSAHDYLLLGDLHMRQGQPKEALNAYRSALNHLSPTAGDSHTLSQLSELHKKLAQAYLALSELEKARKEIALLEELEKRQAPKRDRSAKPAENQLPWKLMITAPKKLLEKAGSGTISFEAFKAGVTVDELFPS